MNELLAAEADVSKINIGMSIGPDEKDAVIDLILAAERVARRVKRITSQEAPGSIGEQEADALLAALDRFSPLGRKRSS